MTLAEKILTYDAEKFTSSEIGRFVGCKAAYVRAVWQRQRSEVLAKEWARNRAMSATADKAMARKAYRVAYSKASKNGSPASECIRAARAAYNRVIRSTYDKRAASAAYRGENYA